MKVKFELNSLEEILKKRGLQEMGPVQKYIDNSVLKLNKPYMPFANGILEKSGDINTVVGSGEIVYSTPYAARLYYNPDYNFDDTAHTLAGGEWFEGMKIDHKQNILEGVRKISGAK